MSRHVSAYLMFGFECDNYQRLEDGCRIHLVGDDDNMQSIVSAICVEAYVKSDPITVDTAVLLQDTTEARNRLQQQCIKHGIEFKEPRWILASAFQ